MLSAWWTTVRFVTATTRVALVTRIPRESPGALALNVQFSPVAYGTDQEVRQELLDIINNIRNEHALLASIERSSLLNWLFIAFTMIIICSKHRGFHEETEWRAVYSPNRNRSPLMETSTEVIARVPQIVHKIPMDRTAPDALADIEFSNLFDRLIIGPTPYPWAVAGAFIDALRAAGVADAEHRVVVSNIPIRQ